MKTLLMLISLCCAAHAEEPTVTWPDVWRLEVVMCEGKEAEAVWLYRQCVEAYNMPHAGEYRANYVEIMIFCVARLLPEWEGRRQRALSDLAKWETRAK